ncbi:hypothetical protein [Methylocystis heyeri]|uniref:Uncharacterized protein n=1 Tax=Methylocystis heyeri TaxID=391905 RepID=A0A6B8KD47_9HYPH|nr:hypothetical protein [Methylocystis heyeri]QGM46156.1 hypothetical protein H2LOC_010860 [Methylocystis heyeri]
MSTNTPFNKGARASETSSPITPTYRDLAEALRNADMASLPVDARDDVIAIMSHLRAHLVHRFDALDEWQRQLATREDNLNKITSEREARLGRKEKELAQGLRTLGISDLDVRAIPGEVIP